MPFISHSVKPTEMTMGMKGTVLMLVLLACSPLMSANTTVSTTAPVPASGDNSAPNVTSTTLNPTSTNTSSSTEPTTSTSGQPITENPATSSTTKITTTPVSSTSTTTTSASSTTTTTSAPSTTTTSAPSTTTPCPPPSHERHFDFLSFVGGILFTAGAIGLLLLAYKYFGPDRGDKGAYNRIGMKDLYGESENFEL